MGLGAEHEPGLHGLGSAVDPTHQVRDRPGDAQHAMIAARGKPHRFGGIEVGIERGRRDRRGVRNRLRSAAEHPVHFQPLMRGLEAARTLRVARGTVQARLDRLVREGV